MDAGVVDMPSIDDRLLLEIYDTGKPILVAEQNNGFILPALRAVLMEQRDAVDTGRLHARNTLDATGDPRFIHSGTYSELTSAHGLDAASLADTVATFMKKESKT